MESSRTNGSTPFLCPQGPAQKEHMARTGQIKPSLGAGTGGSGERGLLLLDLEVDPEEGYVGVACSHALGHKGERLPKN